MSSESDRNERMEKIVSLCKRRGFIFQSAEMYGGMNGCWDYGPLGAELKRNLKEAERIVDEPVLDSWSLSFAHNGVRNACSCTHFVLFAV